MREGGRRCVVAAGKEIVEAFTEYRDLVVLLGGQQVQGPAGQGGLVQQLGDQSAGGAGDADGQIGPPR